MRYLTVTIMLFVGGCSASATEEGKKGAEASGAAEALHLTALEQRAKSQLEAKVRKERELGALQASVKEAMAGYLFDPGSAQYRELRAGRNGAICGKLNGKNRLGAYVGFKDFVVSRDKQTVYVSGSNDGINTEMDGSFAEAYLNACASAAERSQHEQANAELHPPEPEYVPSPTEDAERDFSDAETGYTEDSNMTFDEMD